VTTITGYEAWEIWRSITAGVESLAAADAVGEARRGFTRRHCQVVQLLSEGRGLDGAADDLGVSRTTVSSHMRRVSSLLAAQGVERAGRKEVIVLEFLRRGLIG